MKTTSIKHVAHLAEICFRKGIRHVVISPGSRNAPLIIAFDAHPGINVKLVHDERSAAFVAIGMADELGEPVAVACTSGSAALNYAPAIAEAYYRNVPLLVLTADRPVYLVDQGDGQTIRQKNLYSNYIKASYEVPENDLERSDELVNQALSSLVVKPQGPVHINIPLDEPLYQTEEMEIQPLIQPVEPVLFSLSPNQTQEIQDIWTKSAKKLVLIGQLNPNPALKEAIIKLAEDPSVCVLVENTSNISKFGSVVHCIDRALATIQPEELSRFAPDLLLTLGDAIISKKIKVFLRANKPAVNWRVGIHPFEMDTYQSLTVSFQVDPVTFIQELNRLEVNVASNYGNQWKQKDFLAMERQEKFLDDLKFCDLKAFELILDTMPDDCSLHMANSSVVRYCQLFNPVENTRYYSNRGVSGIDGSTSTAVGMALANPDRLVLLITGDISFFYDSNGLWNTAKPDNLRIMVINNGGGGIFQIIPGPSETDQSAYFKAAHQASVEGICQAYQCTYRRVDTEMDFLSQLNEYYRIEAGSGPCILEIDTSAQANSEALKAYFKAIGTSF